MLPVFALVFVGSLVAGWLSAWVSSLLIRSVNNASTSVILQFVMTFGVWIFAERLGLSGVVTIFVFGLTAGRMTSRPMSPRLRVSSFATWDAATAVLNILAFTLIGLQIRPILEALDQGERAHAIAARVSIFTGRLANWLCDVRHSADAPPRVFLRPPLRGDGPPRNRNKTMTKLDSEIYELTTDELNEVSGGAGISIDFGYATVTMAWGASCKMIAITGNDGHTTYADNGKC